ncbi:unnamed protein product [Rangifer tarandus platyrhynchus]|uniref:Uncharacterized protein n=1 Tax=Rangifer tarandus platyrhynchus TaxID=3082113 RepID=A0AC59ZZG4_RANTA
MPKSCSLEFTMILNPSKPKPAILEILYQRELGILKKMRCSHLKPGYEGEIYLEVKVRMISQIWGIEDL